MNRTDKYFIDTLIELRDSTDRDKEPRAKYKDGAPAFTQFLTQKTFTYDISKGEFPINTLRNTAVKGGWYDIEAIYIKQTNIIEEMHPSIHSWWKDFVVSGMYVSGKICKDCEDMSHLTRRSIGQTYGDTVKRYDLMNRLLKGLVKKPFGRRHIINLWQEQQMIEDPSALVPCCYETLWTVRNSLESLPNKDGSSVTGLQLVRYVDLTMNQRSMDYLMTSSINPTQYVMFGMAVCGHLTKVTKVKHTLGIFQHHIQNLHVYDRHLWAIEELLSREPKEEQPTIELLSNKKFYDYTIEDFKITIPTGIEKLSRNLELAI